MMSRHHPSDQSSARPVTLHINTGKGTAVVQVQTTSLPGASASTTITAKHAQRPMRTFSSLNVIPPHAPSSSFIGSSSVTSSSSVLLPNPSVAPPLMTSSSSSRIFPASISLPSSSSLAAAAAAAAAFGGYFYAPTATADQLSAYQNLMALQHAVAAQQHSIAKQPQPPTFGAPSSFFASSASKYLSPVGPNFASDLQQHLSSAAAHQHRCGAGLNNVRLPTSPLNQQGAAAVYQGVSGSPTAPLYHYGVQTGAQPGSTTPGQSPRPNILRKRPIDATTIAPSLSSSAASKRLTYDASVCSRPTPHVLSTIVRRLADMAPLAQNFDSGAPPRFPPATAIAYNTASELADAGNSNHSSSASTASGGSSFNDVVAIASSATGASATVFSDVTASPSPRKRQRKQRLDDLPRDNPPPASSSSALTAFWPSAATFNVGSDVRLPSEPRIPPTLVTISSGSDVKMEQSELLDRAASSVTRFQPISLPGAEYSDKTKIEAASMRNNEETSVATSYASSTVASTSASPSVEGAASRPTLLSSDSVAAMGSGDASASHWCPRRNHFRRRDHVRASSSLNALMTSSKVNASALPPTPIHELCQPSKRIADRVDAWRLHLVAQNLAQLFACQGENLAELDSLLTDVDAWDADDAKPNDASSMTSRASLSAFSDEIRITKEMMLTSRQRCLAVRENLLDARSPLNRILQHRSNADDLVVKYAVRRTVRKKAKPT